MPKTSFVLFDFDGVIVDSFGISYDARSKIYPIITQDEYRQFFDGNIYDASKKFPEKIVDIDFFKLYTPELMRLPIVEGMKEVLEKLQKDYSLVLISSTLASSIEDYLKQNNLARYFCEIMGPEAHKNKNIKIQMLFDKYVFGKDDCIFITDTLGDIKEAAQCSVESIGVTWGFHKKENLQKGNPFAIVETPEELFKTIHRFFG